MMQKNKTKSGFTLVETIITVVIIGLVAALVIGLVYFNYKEHRNKAISIKIIENITKLNEAQSLYYSKFSKYATKDELLQSGILKSWPIAEKNIADEACLMKYGHSFDYQFWYVEAGQQNSGSENFEYAAVLPCVKEQYAITFNDLTFYK